MSFRLKLTLLTALAIAVTVAATSAAVWVVAKHQLLTQVDQTLQQRANTIARSSDHGPGPFGQNGPYYLVSGDGHTQGSPLLLPSEGPAVKPGKVAYLDVTIQGYRMRELVAGGVPS